MHVLLTTVSSNHLHVVASTIALADTPFMLSVNSGIAPTVRLLVLLACILVAGLPIDHQAMLGAVTHRLAEYALHQRVAHLARNRTPASKDNCLLSKNINRASNVQDAQQHAS